MVKYFTKTAIGYSHIKQNKPCQDFSASYHDDERTIVTACDGHGGAVYIRSSEGSKFASDAVINVFKRVDKSLFYRLSREDIENKLRLEILCEWNGLVEKHLSEKPIKKKETEGLSEDQIFRLRMDKQTAYGTTLQGAMIFGNKFICASIGDGGCMAFKRKDLFSVFTEDDDENVANITSSMCQTDAFDHLKVKIFDVSSADGVLVFTDGLVNPYRNLDNFASSFVTSVMQKIDCNEFESISKFIDEMGLALGVGDDVSFGVISAKRKRYGGK